MARRSSRCARSSQAGSSTTPGPDAMTGAPAVGLVAAWQVEEGTRRDVPGIVLGEDDFTLTAEIEVPAATRSGIGDVAALFDPDSRRGFSIGLNHGSPCGNHGNDRNLFFGIDAGTEPLVTDHGQPSPATIMVCALAVFEGALYAATWETGPESLGHVYRLAGKRWIDCGAVGGANAVTRLAVHDAHLYAGASRLRGGGSGMPDSPNTAPGGHVYRYDGDDAWVDVGGLDGAGSVARLVPHGGDLYAIPMYSQGLLPPRPH